MNDSLYKWEYKYELLSLFWGLFVYFDEAFFVVVLGPEGNYLFCQVAALQNLGLNYNMRFVSAGIGVVVL